MKQIFNYCPVLGQENEIFKSGKNLSEFIKSLGLDGAELMVYLTEPYPVRYEREAVGVHLNYWPYWLDFWCGYDKNLRCQFNCREECQKYFGGAQCTNERLNVIRANIRAALCEKPEYLVWHVAEADTKEIFTFSFKHDDNEVITHAAEVFNAVADEIPSSTLVLFENLWWPGLRLNDVSVVKKFFSLIRKNNVGIVLDTGHLMNTNPELGTEEEGIDFICQQVKGLEEEAKRIKAIHLSCSLSGEYLKNYDFKIPQEINGNVIMQHVTSIDQHKPFTTPYVFKLVDLIKPEYLVHELSYFDFCDFEKNIRVQKNALESGAGLKNK